MGQGSKWEKYMSERNTNLLFARHSRYVQSFMEISNMEAMRAVTLPFVVVSLLALFSTALPIAIWTQRSSDVVLQYRLAFGAAAILNALFWVLSRRYLSQKRPEYGPGRYYVLIYIVAQVVLSLWVTIADFAYMGRYFILLVTLFVLFGLFFIPPANVFVVNGVVFACVMIGLSNAGLLSPIQVITLSFYLAIIMAVSVSNYASRVRIGRTNERIVSAARHDDLTGVLNRHAFDEDVHRMVGQDLELMLTDLDDFKSYNELHGHSVGDELLRAFAQSLAECFGPGRAYRFGGDEFIVVYPASDDDDFAGLVDSWHDSYVSWGAAVNGTIPTFSAGCVRCVIESEERMEDILRIADSLLFQAKDSGRDQVVYARYSDGLLRQAITQSGMSDAPDESIDPVTGLLVRPRFIVHCAEVAPVLLEKGHSVSFVYFNIANFKDYNAKYGFAEGDDLLRSVANTLRDVFPNRMLSRFGDDRFVVMTEEVGLVEAVERACTLARDLHPDRLYSLRAGVFRYVSADVGVRTACDCARIACDSLRGHYNKSYCYYTDDLGTVMERRNRVLEKFGAALENGYIQPFYQPIIRSVSDLVCEFEILARWVDPNEGMLSPAEFIPALEESYLIHLLDLHIVEQVCQNFETLMADGLSVCPVSINFSRLDFEACDLVREVLARLDAHGLPHDLIRVEVTESAFSEDAEHIQECLAKFREEGMQVWMDDFGSGYSALSVLREFDFDLVKFDMSFVQGLTGDMHVDSRGIMLTNLVSMVKELGLQTLIEGVEDVDQLFFLRHISFEKIQGYVFGRPEPFEAVREKLHTWAYMVEDPNKRAYYDLVGKVNLVQPVDPGSAFDPTGVADGVPVAILELSDGTLRYLGHNDAYEKRIAYLGLGSVIDSENALNRREGSIARTMWPIVARLQATDDWVRIEHGADNEAVGYARRVARVDNSTIAFIICAPPVGVRRTLKES